MTAFVDLQDCKQGGYSLILADPPWHFKSYSGDGGVPTAKKRGEVVGKNFRSAEKDHYLTTKTIELSALPVARLAAKDSLLAMWVVGSHIEEAIDLGRFLGFHYVTDLFWWLKQKMVNADQICLFSRDIPPPAISMGYHSRKQGEMVLLFKRGKGLKVLRHDVRQIIIAPPREHICRGIDAVANRIERLRHCGTGVDPVSGALAFLYLDALHRSGIDGAGCMADGRIAGNDWRIAPRPSTDGVV